MLSGELLGALGPTALAGLAVLLVLVGRLIPLRSHLRELNTANQRTEDWRTAYLTERARADLATSQLGEILAALKQAREPT